MNGEYQLVMTQALLLSAVEPQRQTAARSGKDAFPADKEKNIVPIDYEKMNAHKSKYLDRWNKEVLGA